MLSIKNGRLLWLNTAAILVGAILISCGKKGGGDSGSSGTKLPGPPAGYQGAIENAGGIGASANYRNKGSLGYWAGNVSIGAGYRSKLK